MNRLNEETMKCPTVEGRIPEALSEERKAICNLEKSIELLIDKVHTVRNLEEPTTGCIDNKEPQFSGSSMFCRVKEDIDHIHELNTMVVRVTDQIQL